MFIKTVTSIHCTGVLWRLFMNVTKAPIWRRRLTCLSRRHRITWSNILKRVIGFIAQNSKKFRMNVVRLSLFEPTILRQFIDNSSTIHRQFIDNSSAIHQLLLVVTCLWELNYAPTDKICVRWLILFLGWLKHLCLYYVYVCVCVYVYVYVCVYILRREKENVIIWQVNNFL